jgi:putative transposase
VDTYGQTLDFLLTEPRDERAALRFLTKAIHRHGVPEKITIEGSEANAAAIRSDNEEHGTALIIRQVKYLTNQVEQDHRAVTRVTRPRLGFNSFEAAQGTLVGIERMPRLKQGQSVIEAGGAGLTPAEQFYALAASSPHRRSVPYLHAKFATELSCSPGAPRCMQIEFTRQPERALAIDPEDSAVPFTLCGLGRVLEHLGDLKGAKTSYQKALTIAETQQGAKYDAKAVALLYLGYVLQLLGDRKGGIAYVKRGMALGKVAYAKEFPEAAATLSHMELALEGGAVISRMVH